MGMSLDVLRRRAAYPRPVRFRAAAAAGAAVLVVAVPAAATPAGPHAVPPPAPSPTDSANSPAAPDPHPPRGGIGPLGEAVGGARLLHRGLVLPEDAPRLPGNLTARAWVVVDLDSGDVLAARDPHGRYQPASIQKLLTAVTLLPVLRGSRRVTISSHAAGTEGSHAGLVAGGRYTVDQLFRALLLVSGNDAAEALAEAAGGRAQTVAAMNATAMRLGAYDTYVQTPSGLDGWQQLTSAYDMALILRAALTQPRFVAYDRTARAMLPVQKINGFGPVELDNQNELFLQTVRGALVAKTGYTDAAQHTFVGAIRRHGRRYGVVLLRAQRWPLDQWQQAARLVSWAARLPAGTPPVGTLDRPVASAAASLAPHGRAGGLPLRFTTRRGAADAGPPVLAIVIALAALAALAAAGSVPMWRRRRRPSRRRPGSPPPRPG
jgi:serine-type D-Ala-D-Ala carboxypeptidase (penicillin-binding protein 5/6)